MEVTVILSWLFILVIGYLCGKWASKKGYNFWAWFFGGSLLGAITLFFMPNVNDLVEEKRAKQINTGNTAGIILAVASLVWGFAQGFYGSK
jgi:ethanolamine transporter EutH